MKLHLMLIAFACCLAGCERPIDAKTGQRTVDLVMGPDQYGVVCYLEIGPNNRSLSCVKVTQ